MGPRPREASAGDRVLFHLEAVHSSDGNDDTTTPESAGDSKGAPGNPPGRPHLNAARLEGREIAADILADAADKLHGVLAQRLGVKHQTVGKWCNGELPMAAGDIVAAGPEFLDRVARGFKAAAAVARARLRNRRSATIGSVLSAGASEIEEAAKLFQRLRERVEDGIITPEEAKATRAEAIRLSEIAEQIADSMDLLAEGAK